MGTETSRLQQEIKDLIKRLGWSQKRFARELHAMMAEGDCDTDDEISQFEERIKKQLSRESTPNELLGEYLRKIHQHPACETIDTIRPSFIPSRNFPDKFISGMKRISKELDKP